ncbi:MAG: ABC transporter permease [Pseudomonadota bacterium]
MTGATSTQTAAQKQTRLKVWLIRSILPVALALTYVFFGLIEPRFYSLENMVNILNQSSYLAMLATAQMLVLMCRGFDVSIGSVVSMVGVCSSAVMVWVLKNHPGSQGMAITICWLFGLTIGGLAGAINGFNVAIVRINPIVATLGMLSVAGGIAATATGGFGVMNLPPAFIEIFSRSRLLGLPPAIWVSLLVLAGLHFLLVRTKFGRSIYMTGANPEAAHVAGVSTRITLIGAHFLCSLVAAVVAIMLTARTGSGEPNLGGGLMLQCIMAAVIGGVSLRGGVGKVWYCIFGAIFVTILGNGMNLVRFSGYFQEISLGVILIAAVFLDGLRRRYRE